MCWYSTLCFYLYFSSVTYEEVFWFDITMNDMLRESYKKMGGISGKSSSSRVENVAS